MTLRGCTTNGRLRCAACSEQKGYETLRFASPQTPDVSRVHARQTGWLRHGTSRREITHFQIFTEIAP